MVAYNFMRQFAEKVESGIKPHTIRDNHWNGRHAKAGDKLQLYTGQRTKQCRKLLDALCLGTWEIDIRDSKVRILTVTGWVKLLSPEIEAPGAPGITR